MGFNEKKMKQRFHEIGDNMENTSAVGLLSLSSYSSAARAQMLTQHLPQSLVLKNPEFPNVSTGYEDVYGDFSTCYNTTDHNYQVVKKICKHGNYVYTLLLYDKKHDMYHIAQRNEVHHFSEHYGYTWNNDVIDSLQEGDIIPKDTVLSKAPCFDDEMNFGYGVNANVVYVISQRTIEDAMLISESFAKKLTVDNVEECRVTLNDNDIPLNLYGDKELYESFPYVGSKVSNAILMGVRSRNKKNDHITMKNSMLRKIIDSDTLYQFNEAKTMVADIDMYSNRPIDDIPDNEAYRQVKNCYESICKYWTSIYNTLDEIINGGGSSTYSVELSRLYQKAKDFLDPAVKYTDDGKIFSNISIEFTLVETIPVRQGSKICGRFGNKSVSRIVPDEEMGITEDGIVPDIQCDVLGVPGRLNSGQLFEQGLNWVAEKVRAKICKASSRKEKIDIYLDFIKDVDQEQYEKAIKFFDTEDGDTIDEQLKIVEDVALHIHQSPFYSITGERLKKLFEKYKMKPKYMYYKDDNGNEYKTLRPMVVAKEYMMRLKQEPVTKFSSRSLSYENPISCTPIKSLLAKKHKKLIPDQANKSGEQELGVLLVCGDPRALDHYYRSNSSSIAGRRNPSLFIDDPYDGHEIHMENDRSRVIDTFNAYTFGMGIQEIIKYEDTPDTYEDADDDDTYEDMSDDISDTLSPVMIRRIENI